MGERVNIIIGANRNVGIVLFSNSCHPEVDAEAILRQIVASSPGVTDTTVRLLAVTYPSTVANNREGDRVFSVDTEPGDHEKVLYVFDGKVVDGNNVDFRAKIATVEVSLAETLFLDATTAERVMGWAAGQCWPRCYLDDNGGHWSVASTCGHPGARDFRPATDPAADYLVLEKVRSTWSRHDLGYFHHLIEEMWEQRADNPRIMGHAEQYRPGDYAKAALMALGVYDGDQGEPR